MEDGKIIRIRTSGIYVADQRISSVRYDVESECRIVILIPLQGDGARDVSVRMKYPGGSVTLLGFVRLSGDTNCTFTTDQHHQAPDTESRLYIKSVLSGRSKLIYNGSIRVDQKAQRTNSYQRNENLLLSEDAVIETSPTLEIKANNVRCTHGATISSLSLDELWYLKSRGITHRDAEKLIVSGFLMSVFEHIADTGIRNQAQSALRTVMPMA